MPPKEKTLMEPPETLGNQTEYDAVMARLRTIQSNVTVIMNAQAAYDDRQTLVMKQLDHLDLMVHEVHQFIEEHKPALAKGLALLDPGSSVRKYWRQRKGTDTDGG
jgi:hypothetical protein